jgi:hypothetical protein
LSSRDRFDETVSAVNYGQSFILRTKSLWTVDERACVLQWWTTFLDLLALTSHRYTIKFRPLKALI